MRSASCSCPLVALRGARWCLLDGPIWRLLCIVDFGFWPFGLCCCLCNFILHEHPNPSLGRKILFAWDGASQHSTTHHSCTTSHLFPLCGSRLAMRLAQKQTTPPPPTSGFKRQSRGGIRSTLAVIRRHAQPRNKTTTHQVPHTARTTDDRPAFALPS